MNRLRKAVSWLKENSITIMLNLIFLLMAFAFFISMRDLYRNNLNPPELKEYKGGIQNRLVWSVSGECYFVRPHNEHTNYLVRTQDCDKK